MTTTSTKEAWGEVGNRLSALCLKLKLHAEEELSDEEVYEKVGLNRLRAPLEEAAEAITDAYQDEAVRADAKDVASAVLAAVESTARDVRTRVTPT